MNKIAQNNLRLVKLLEAPTPAVKVEHKLLIVNRRKRKYSFRYFWERMEATQ